MTDSVRLKDRITQAGLKKSFIAKSLNLTYQGYLNKENGKHDFTATELSIMKKLLVLNDKEFKEIFLSEK